MQSAYLKAIKLARSFGLLISIVLIVSQLMIPPPSRVSAATKAPLIARWSAGTVASTPGNPWAWGINSYGQLGNGTTGDSLVPVQVSGQMVAIATAADGYHSLTLKSDGSVWSWGNNELGQLGNGTTVNSSTPVQVSGLSDVTFISSGAYHSLAVKSDGSMRAWGHNDPGSRGGGYSVGGP